MSFCSLEGSPRPHPFVTPWRQGQLTMTAIAPPRPRSRRDKIPAPSSFGFRPEGEEGDRRPLSARRVPPEMEQRDALPRGQARRCAPRVSGAGLPGPSRRSARATQLHSGRSGIARRADPTARLPSCASQRDRSGPPPSPRRAPGRLLGLGS